MRFTDREEADAFFRRLGVGPEGVLAASRAATRFKTERFYYQSRLDAAPEVAQAVVQSLGSDADIVVWAAELVFGDRSSEADPPPHWSAYARWRRQTGITANLYATPGHVFSPGERDDAVFVVEQAIHMGWDALIGARAGKPIIALSHDDCIIVHARSHPTDLYQELERYGLTRPES